MDMAVKRLNVAKYNSQEDATAIEARNKHILEDVV